MYDLKKAERAVMDVENHSAQLMEIAGWLEDCGLPCGPELAREATRVHDSVDPLRRLIDDGPEGQEDDR